MSLDKEIKYRAVVIGTSAGGLFALTAILSSLPGSYPIPIIIVQHRSKDQKNLLEEVLQYKCRIRIKQADEKEAILGGIVYIAPPDYHLLVEANETFSLSYDEQVMFSRPSINVLFETAAMVYKGSLLGIILTGASNDGADGVRMINQMGGTTIAQDPDEAHFPFMPMSSIETNSVSHVLKLSDINKYLMKIADRYHEK